MIGKVSVSDLRKMQVKSACVTKNTQYSESIIDLTKECMVSSIIWIGHGYFGSGTSPNTVYIKVDVSNDKLSWKNILNTSTTGNLYNTSYASGVIQQVGKYRYVRISGSANREAYMNTIYVNFFGGGVIDSFLSLLKFLRKSVANMLGKIFTQPISFFPPQYKYKLGTLSLSKLDGNKYIPLAINIRGAGARNNGGSHAKTVFKDNNGKELAYITNGPCGSYSQNTYWSDENMTIDLLSIYKADFENLKTFRNVTMTPGNITMAGPSFNIVSWLEKEGF